MRPAPKVLVMKENVSRALTTLDRVLMEIGWASGSDGSRTCHRIDLGPPRVPVSDVLVAIHPEAECLLFLANFAPAVTTSRRDEVARFLNGVNWDLLIGNFEMNPADGSVRFRTTFDFSDGELQDRSIRHAILTSMEVVEAHADLLMGAIDIVGRE